MKLLIFGSTGGTGRELVRIALGDGHTVTAFARNPAALDMPHPDLTIVQGDVLDYSRVEQTVPGHDAVFCALGAGRSGKVRSEGTRNIIRAMETAGVRRLVCQTTLGVGDSRDNLNFFWKYIMFGVLLRPAFADHVRQEEYIRASSLDWIIVRPGAFTDGPRTGEYQHGFPGSAQSLALKISRADVADFMVKQLTDDAYVRQAPGLSY